LLVIVEDGKVKVCAPPAGEPPALKVTYGADLVEFQADVDARSQLKSVQAAAWNPKSQSMIIETAAPASLHEQGNLESGRLAQVIDLAQYRLQTATPLDHAALAAWGKAQQVKAGLARVRGRMKFQGSAAAHVGALIEVAGVGARYNGHAFMGAVEHEIADGNWFTVAEIGLAPEWFCERSDVAAPPAAGWVPGSEGLQIGVVVALDGDPAGEQRVQIKLPVLGTAADGADNAPRVWARLAQLHASGGFGGFFVPEIGDEVIVGFFNHDPTHPVVLGSLYSSNHKPAYALEAENDIKAIVTRCLSRIEFNEKDKVITIVTPQQNRAVLSDKQQSILLQDQNGNKVELNPQGITIDTPRDLKISAKGTITVEAVGAISVSSTANAQIHGLNVACEADVGFSAKGSATAELSAAGQTTVRGAMVMIN
jgi:Rhs element Vgr protein